MTTAALTLGGDARAQVPVQPMQPQPLPGNTCDIAVSPMRFPNYDPSVPYDTSAVDTFSIFCNAPHVLVISLITNDRCMQRYLRRALDRLAYNLYQDAGNSIVWGSLNPICGRVETDSILRRTDFSVYGLLPREQNVRAGTYTDVVTIEADF
ncbi:MAG: spore coat protein U domain-containing protein [Candidatus Aquilonibacter sp.]